MRGIYKMAKHKSYPNALQVLESSLKEAPKTSVTQLAKELISYAKQYDLQRHALLGIDPRYLKEGVKADFENPPYFDHPNIKGAQWADDADTPLEAGEEWNKGRRSTLTGAVYDLDERNHPINPYEERGLKGRGLLGSFGPNYTTDNGAVCIAKNKEGKKRLHVTGIIRKDNGQPAFAGGFAESKKLPDGSYVLDQETIIDTLTKEFFEEMVSGSVELRPDYADRFEPEFTQIIEDMVKKRDGDPLSSERMQEKHSQVLTELKYEQVKAQDPTFLLRLREVISQGRECYAGPVLTSGRNTDNAWIETSLYWYLLDDNAWAYIKGDNPVFSYELSAGDDAAGVVLHDVRPELVVEASASHGPMFVFLGASYLLHMQEQGHEIEPDIIEQFQEIKTFLCAALKKHPASRVKHAL